MNKHILAGVAFAGLLTSGAALAADLPRRAAPPVVYAPPPLFTWTGFYAGLNAGYGFSTRDNENPGFLNVPAGTFAAGGFPATAGTITYVVPTDNDSSGFVGGGQIGYNYQFRPGGGVVVGVEADIQYADLRNRNFNPFGSAGFFTNAVPGPAGTPPGFTVVDDFQNRGVDWFGTVRGRLGWAWDRWLVYGTGGFAYGGGGSKGFCGAGLGGGSGCDDTRVGWTAGGGVEWALAQDSWLNFFRSSAVSLKLEGLYVNLDRKSDRTVIGYDAAGIVYSVPSAGNRDEGFAVIRAGINYRFGSY
jgi:outer membrane immunogenic protein